MRQQPVRTLRFLYLKGMLQVLLPVLLIGTVLSYLYAAHNVENVYDLDLLDDANDLLHQVQVHQSGDLALDLPLAARQMLLTNNEESVVYAVWDENRKLLSGSATLFSFASQMESTRSQEFDTVNFSGHEYRMIRKYDAIDGHPLYIVVAETTTAIHRLLSRVLTGFIFLGVLLTLFAIIGIMHGVRQGLVPVAMLRDSIARRSHGDFSLLPEATAPEELQPIIHGINDLLHTLEKSVSDHRRFVADAAHQLRTPLAVLTSKLETALGQPANQGNALLEQLLAVTRRTSHLTNQLLSLSRIENAGIIDVQLKPVALVTLLREKAANQVLVAEQKQVQLEFQLEDCQVPGDRLLLEEVLENLLDNAFRYSGAGSTVTVSLHQQGERVLLQVSDNGNGVTPETLARLGQPFFRGNTGDTEGCGLGLAIVAEIINLHRGTVSFSVPASGRGLCVTVDLPALSTQTSPAANRG